MIRHTDQMNLFKLIADRLKSDVECYAFGGNAMMFYGYKDQTKDIDILFENRKHRQLFITALESLDFSIKNPGGIYLPEKLRERHKPVMYTRDDFRLDIFTQQIFETKLSPKMKNDLFAVHEFRGKKNIKMNVLRKEHIVFLKAITEREKDIDDILSILQMDKYFDWQYLIDETIWQHKNGNSWAILDMEKTMRELKKYVLIQHKYFEQVYEAQK